MERKAYFVFLTRHSLLAILIVVAGAAFAIVWLSYASFLQPDLAVADSLKTCTENGQNKAEIVACTRTTIRSLLEENTTQALMLEIATSTFPAEYYGCHSIGHIIGAETYKKEGTLEGALAECTNHCSYACIHGVIGEAVKEELGETYPDDDIAHMDVERLESIGKKYCEGGIGFCHAIGHILFIALNDFKKALAGCNKVASGVQSENCSQGVFMQGVGGIGESLILGDSPPAYADVPEDNYRYPCDMVDARHKHACFQFLPVYQGVVLTANNVTDVKEKLRVAETTCMTFTGRARAECFEGIGRYMGFGLIFPTQTEGGAIMCEQFESDEDQAACVLGRIYTLTQYDRGERAANYCAKLVSEASQTLCYQAIFQLEFVANETTAAALCGAAAESCLAKYKEYVVVRDTLPNYRFGLYGEVR